MRGNFERVQRLYQRLPQVARRWRLEDALSPHLFLLAIASIVVLALAGIVLALRLTAPDPVAGVLVLDEPEVAVEPPPVLPPETQPPPPPAAPIPGPTKSAPRVTVKKTQAPAFRYDVARVQQRLTELKYYVGPINGRVSAPMRSAVMAFQKVNGLPANGSVGPATLARLDNPVLVKPVSATPAVHVEVDLTRQVLLYVRQGQVERIMPVSSGNGATYKQKNGATARALTPVGWYKIQRKITGLREADLGSLYDPMYFYKGWALHGSNSVPARPASHGCVRLTRWDAVWLFARAPVGLDVYLHGGRYTFPAGSSAPGTDNPTGDTPDDAPSAPPSTSPPASSPSSPSSTPSPSPSTSPSDDPEDDDDQDLPGPWSR
ncbi:MAG: L,D-transpeptidase family protein [Nitriliruptorales bacterium]